MQLYVTEKREIPTKIIRTIVINESKSWIKLLIYDFNSVYHSFKDIRKFGKELAKLQD
ncbi:MAG: hypothetical protein ACTS7E_03905 [Arsenophonus sp. NC-CH8-MAG3]